MKREDNNLGGVAHQPGSRLNQTVANTSTKSQTFFFSSEVDEQRVERIRNARKEFTESEKSKLLEQIEDLTTTVNINKQLMSEVFSAAGASSDVTESRRKDKTVHQMLNQENHVLL